MSPLPHSLTLEAEQDAKKGAAWYEGESKGLGSAFLEIMDRTLATVVENPHLFPVVHRDVRRALLKRFPYGVFFRIKPDRIRVIAVTHLARNPSTWQKRR